MGEDYEMRNTLLSFDLPQLYNLYDRDEILCNLESLALSAFRISSGDGMGCVETDIFDFENDDDSVDAYEESLDELIEVVGGYNYIISESKIDEPLIRLVVDYEKTNLLNDGGRYPIYKVVLCDAKV
jgi:hypothetical protein